MFHRIHSGSKTPRVLGVIIQTRPSVRGGACGLGTSSSTQPLGLPSPARSASPESCWSSRTSSSPPSPESQWAGRWSGGSGGFTHRGDRGLRLRPHALRMVVAGAPQRSPGHLMEKLPVASRSVSSWPSLLGRLRCRRDSRTVFRSLYSGRSGAAMLPNKLPEIQLNSRSLSRGGIWFRTEHSHWLHWSSRVSRGHSTWRRRTSR